MKNQKDTDKLKAYYGNYLSEIRGLSNSSVKHYFDALNNISCRLKNMGLIKRNIYEITSVSELENIRDALYADSDFIELNTRGRRMYSAGLNNYIRFASGEDFQNIAGEVVKLDTPIAPEEPVFVEQIVWKRSNILRKQAIALAGYSCEFDKTHSSFIAESNREPYMEGHHAIPMRLQSLFENSLDIYANIVCLCPLCHKKIHHGLKNERKDMIYRIYDERAERLENSGIKVDRQEFAEIILNGA